jgi:hypothetical protein
MAGTRRKKPGRVTKVQHEEFVRSWHQRNKEFKAAGIPTDTFEQYMEWLHGKGKEKSKAANNTEFYTPTTTQVRPALEKYLSNNAEGADAGKEEKGRFARISGPCSSKPPMVYTGTKMVGIAVMHKSNSVPVFSSEEAADISNMRR